MSDPERLRRPMMRPNAETPKRLGGRADQGEVAVAAQELNVGVDVVIGGDGVEDEIEAAGVLLHLAGVAGDDDAIGVATIGDADQAAGLGDTADDLMAGNNSFPCSLRPGTVRR